MFQGLYPDLFPLADYFHFLLALLFGLSDGFLVGKHLFLIPLPGFLQLVIQEQAQLLYLLDFFGQLFVLSFEGMQVVIFFYYQLFIQLNFQLKLFNVLIHHLYLLFQLFILLNQQSLFCLQISKNILIGLPLGLTGKCRCKVKFVRFIYFFLQTFNLSFEHCYIMLVLQILCDLFFLDEVIELLALGLIF